MSPDGLRDLEESLWRPETRYDRAYLERVLHPEYLGHVHQHRGRARSRLRSTQLRLDSHRGSVARPLQSGHRVHALIGGIGQVTSAG
jgi:hypothetical protein